LAWDQWKDRFLRGRTPETVPDRAGAGKPYPGGVRSHSHAPDEVGILRQSHALVQFFEGLKGEPGLSILDFGEISQANVSNITQAGHKLYSFDFHRTMQEYFGPDLSLQEDPERSSRFFHENFAFPPESFGGVLLWDALEFLIKPTMHDMLTELSRIVRPGGVLLALFHRDDRSGPQPVYSYRISDEKTLMLTLRGSRTPVQLYNNRGVEGLFGAFGSVKFYLTRDQLREVIVRR
jgi:hypothetical protein